MRRALLSTQDIVALTRVGNYRLLGPVPSLPLIYGRLLKSIIKKKAVSGGFQKAKTGHRRGINRKNIGLPFSLPRLTLRLLTN